MKSTKNIGVLTSLALWAGGYDKETIQSCHSAEINSKAILGSTVFIPPLFALMSFTYAVYIMTRSLSIAITSGLVWAFIVLLLDRAIVGYGKVSDMSKIVIILRILVACVFSATIAEPITTMLFSDAITEQMQAEVSIKRNKVREEFDQPIYDLREKLTNAEDILNKKERDFLQEMDGSAGSKKRGIGQITIRKQQAYLQEKARYESLKQEIGREVTLLSATRSEELAEVQSAYARGLLGSLKALHNIQSPIVTFFVWLIRLLLLFIDLIPIMMKLSKSKDDGSYYPLIEDHNRYTLATQKEKNELLAKEESLEVNREKMRIFDRGIQQILQAQYLNYTSLAQEVTSVTEKEAELAAEIQYNCSDPQKQEQLLQQLHKVFQNMHATIDTLTIKSNEFYARHANT